MPRTKPPIDWSSLEGYMQLNASLEFCAQKQLERISEEVNKYTLRRMKERITIQIKKRYGTTFTEHRSKMIEPIRLSLFQKQVDIAKLGNVTMLIWLGKQLLGQSEKVTDPEGAKSRQYVVVDKIHGGKIIGETELEARQTAESGE